MNNTADQQDPFTPPDQIMPELGGMRYRKHSAKAAYHPTTASPEFVRNRDSTSDEEEEEDREDGPATQPSDSSASADADNRCHIERLPDDVLSRVLGFLPVSTHGKDDIKTELKFNVHDLDRLPHRGRSLCRLPP